MSLDIIDIHPHIISPDTGRYPTAPVRGKQSGWSRDRPQTFEQLIAEMDTAGVSKAAIVQASTFYGFDNSYVADSVSSQPVRFTGVCTIDTLAPDAVAVLKRWMARGISGLRIFTGGSSHAADDTLLGDPRSYPIWEFCGSQGVCICAQTSPSGYAAVRDLLRRFPDTRVVLDHGGRPETADGPPFAQAEPLFRLADFQNLYLKITPRTVALAKGGSSTPESFFGKLISTFGSSRMAYGSNLPANAGPMSALIDEAREALGTLSEGDQAQIFSGTAKMLYPALA